MKKIIVWVIFILICLSFALTANATENEFTRASFCKKITEVLEIEIDSSMLENQFADLDGTEDYYDSVLWMAGNGYMVGYEDGEFKPDYPITNAEVAKKLVDMTVGEFTVPDDVVLENAWYAKYAWKAKQLGLMPDIENWSWYDITCEDDIDYEVLKSLFKNEPYIIDEGICGENINWNIDNNGVLKITGSGNMYNYGLNNRPAWFSYKSEIKKIIISEGVTTIGDYTFSLCRNLTDVTMPNSLTTIGSYAFLDCINLENITIPNNVVSIKYAAFGSCDSLINIVLPDSVCSLGDFAFYDCGMLKSIALSKSMKKIGNYTFDNCVSLESIIIPSGITYIGKYAFNSCGKLTVIDIPQSVTYIGNRAFMRCYNLTSINVDIENNCYTSINGVLFDKDMTSLIQYPTNKSETEYSIPNTVVNINEFAFYYCSKLKRITMSNSVNCIGNAAFFNCSELEAVTLSCNLENIAEETFQECKNLKSINIPNSVKSIGTRAFGHCVKLSNVTIPSSVATIGDRAFYGCEGLVSVLISDGVESIEEFAFCECANITSINIPESITKIEIGVLNCCDKLENICVDNNNLNYCSVDGVLFDKDKKFLIQYPKGKKDFSYVIPDSVIVINDCAFMNCENLTNIEMPEGLTKIGDEAFTACKNLISFKFYSALKSLGISCFSSCSSLEKVEFSDGLTEIPEWAFSYCKSLKTVTMSNTIKNIHNYAFYNCISLIGVYYDGTSADWDAIYIDRKNEPLVNSKLYFQYTKTNVSLDGKTFTVSPVNIENGKTVILALYNEEQFVEMQSAVYTGEAITFATTKSYTEAKVMVWDDLTNLKPLYDVEIVK